MDKKLKEMLSTATSVNLEQLDLTIHQNLVKAADKLVKKYNRRKKPIMYKPGDKVRISAEPPKNKKVQKNYQYIGEIVNVNGNYTYQIKWITNGPHANNEVGTIADKSIPYGLLRPYNETTSEINEMEEGSEILGNVFTENPRGKLANKL